MGSNSSGIDLPILRSLAVSSDIARSLEVVCHFIHVESSKSSGLPAISTINSTDLEELKPYAPAEYTLSILRGAN
jgi:hypothetical protein